MGLTVLSHSLTEKEKGLYELLVQIPPNLKSAERILQTNEYETQELTKVALAYSGDCFCEVLDLSYESDAQILEGIVPNLHSTYICEVLELLLKNGLNPNEVYDDDNIMNSVRDLDNEFLAADALRLLLEYGGNIEVYLPGEGSLFDAVAFDVFYWAFESGNWRLTASLIHCWMVLLGYGARCRADKTHIFREWDSSKLFDLQKLKNHRDYYFGIIRREGYKFAISIFDRATHWEVLRVES